MSGKDAYAGRIKNCGTQIVKAPGQSADEKKGMIRTGKDLRAGK